MSADMRRLVEEFKKARQTQSLAEGADKSAHASLAASERRVAELTQMVGQVRLLRFVCARLRFPDSKCAHLYFREEQSKL